MLKFSFKVEGLVAINKNGHLKESFIKYIACITINHSGIAVEGAYSIIG